MPKKIEVVDVPEGKIVELRQLFLDKLAREGDKVPGGFHPNDLDRIKNRMKWLKLFLEYNDLNMKASLEQLWSTCIWRKKNGLNDSDNEKNANMELLNTGLMFHRNVDVDGKRLLIFKTKLYTRGSYDVEEMKKNLIYYVERLYRESDMEQISPFFDMEDCGLSNMDLDYTRFIINLFKAYYPNSLNYILVYELPWVLTATFKIIKGLLPPKAVDALKFINKKNIGEYITRENQLKCWGGMDDYQFQFVPQNPRHQILPRDSEDMGDGNNNDNAANNRNNPSANGIAKKVHFAPNMSPTVESPLSEQAPSQFSKEEKRLRVHNEGIVFQPNQKRGTLTVENISKDRVMFKVKTTNPEKFRVSPPAGLILPGQREWIEVSFVNTDMLVESARDKFLIMCKPLEEDRPETVPIDAIHKEFKQSPTHEIEQHRVRCIYLGGANDGQGGGNNNNFGGQMDGGLRAAFKSSVSAQYNSLGHDQGRNGDQIMVLQESVRRLEKTLNRIWMVLLATVFLLLAVGVFYASNFNAIGGGTGTEAARETLSENTLPGKGM